MLQGLEQHRVLLPREMLVTQKIGGRKEMRKPKAERSQMCQQGWGLGCMGRPWGRWEPGEEWQWRVKVRRNGVLAIGKREERCNFSGNQGRAGAWEVVTCRGGEQLFIQVWSSG